jgi:hypothetical protein
MGGYLPAVGTVDCMMTRSPPQKTGDDDANAGLSPELIFDALSEVPRQWVLHRLSQEQTVSVNDLVAYLTHHVDDLADRDQTATSLFHKHLPRLQEAAFLTYDADRGTIELRADPDELAPYLELTGVRDLETGP